MAYLGANIIKVQLAACRSSDVDSASERKHLALVVLAVLEVGEFLGKLADVVCDMEL
jgi:hypothetical protein